MNKFIFIIALILFAPHAVAQGNPFDRPIFSTAPTTSGNNCISVTNTTAHTITGDFVSDQYEKKSEWGDTMVSNRHKFKIQKNETQTICPAGPYFPGPSIEFVIRRAFPVFRCKARLGQNLTVRSSVNENGGETLSANCN